MIGSRYVAGAAFLMVTAAAGGVLAQQSYDGPIVGATLSEGRRWGWGARPGATIGGFGFFGGWRFESIRVGFVEQNIWWEGSHGLVMDFGGFVGVDLASVWLDPQLSAALFGRIEPAARFKSNESAWALAPSFVFGGRAAGVEIGFVATPEYWVSELPNNANKLGVDLQVRLGFEFVEVARFIQHINAANEPVTP